MQNITEWMALIAIAVLLAWSGFRISRVKNRFVKWGGAGLLALLCAAVLSAVALTTLGLIKQHSRSAPIPDIKVAATPELVARGKDISDGLCGECHSRAGTLTGGYDLAVELQVPIGSFVAANLTPAGLLKHWSDGEIFRANAGELPQNAGIIEAVPNRLRLPRNIGCGSEIADVDVASGDIDQEARRQDGLIMKPGGEELARPTQPLALSFRG